MKRKILAVALLVILLGGIAGFAQETNVTVGNDTEPQSDSTNTTSNEIEEDSGDDSNNDSDSGETQSQPNQL